MKLDKVAEVPYAPSMKTFLSTLCFGLFAFLLASPAPAGERKDIVSTAVGAGTFTTLAAALGEADLVETLRGDGPFTVFAPTDEAFRRLPEGTVKALLQPAQRDTLRRILLYHVVPGRVLSSDLLTTASADSAAGPALSFGLRVGTANVVKADILCSNGVIHVIDQVLIPPTPSTPTHSAMAVISGAIARGAPLYNDGDHAGCARIYEEAATALLGYDEAQLGSLHRMLLAEAIEMPAATPGKKAWNLRDAFDRITLDRKFEPRMEASMPAGFPAAGPVGQVVVKNYPRYRAARAEGGNTFWTLFRHIKKNDVQMTTPVEMTMTDDMREMDMAFLYEAPDQGEAGMDGRVAVLDVEPLTVLSIGVRGMRSQDEVTRARAAIEVRAERDGWVPAGNWRMMGYNSPMVPAESRYWELQLPVTKAPERPTRVN